MENEKSPREIADAALPSTVLLETEDSNGQPHKNGSGFFVREDEIVTNFHVVEGAYKGSATLYGQYELYDIEGYTALDMDNDLIILKVKHPYPKTIDIPALPLGDSDSVHIGDRICVVSNPEGLEGTISDGIVSGIRPPDPSQGMFYTRIQITAPISPGSSGGAVLNTKGEVIGISAQVLPSLTSVSLPNFQDEQYINLAQNLNFVIPSNSLKVLLQHRDGRNRVIPLSETKLERVTFTGKLGWVGSASYTFPLRNLSGTDVKNVHCEVIFRDKAGNEIKRDSVVFPWVIPARGNKAVIRLSAYDTVMLESKLPSAIRFLRDEGIADYEETDMSDSATESFLIGLADLLLMNIGHTDYSSVKPQVKRLTEDYEIRVVDLEIVD